MDGMFDGIRIIFWILITIICCLVGYIIYRDYSDYSLLSNKSPVKYDCIHFAIEGEKKVVCVARGDINVWRDIATITDPATGIQYTISPPYSIVPLNEIALTGEK